MTSLQVEYWKLEESKRTNLEHEKIDWKNAAAHMLQAKAAMASVGEATRHNKAMEQISWAQLSEQTRHSLATEATAQFEADTRRISVHNEFTIQNRQLDIRATEAATAQFSADTKRMEFEFYEHTKTTELEQEQQRINLAEEQLRIDKWEEARKWVNTGTDFLKGDRSKKDNTNKKLSIIEGIFGLFMNGG